MGNDPPIGCDGDQLRMCVIGLVSEDQIPQKSVRWPGKFPRENHVNFVGSISLVRAYPYVDFQKSTDINMDIPDFWMLVFNYPYKCGNAN